MKNIVFALILGLFSLLTGFAQNKGSLKGTVHDTQGEVMIGAVVVIKETNQFAQVDAKGRYALEKLKPQTSYTVMVSYLGYQTYTKTITEVVVIYTIVLINIVSPFSAGIIRIRIRNVLVVILSECGNTPNGTWGKLIAQA